MWVANVPNPQVPLASVHKHLFGYFPGFPDGDARPFVFGVNENKERIVMASAIRPACPAIEVHPQEGISYQFQALLRPENGGGRGGHRSNDERRDWLRRNVRGAQVGFVEFFDLADLHCTKSDGQFVRFARCRAAGVAFVTDAMAFEEFLCAGGPGTGKTFGMGMWYLPELMP